MNRVAADIFLGESRKKIVKEGRESPGLKSRSAFIYLMFIPAIMRFMGDAPLKAQTEQDLVTTVLKVLTHIILIREINYQFMLWKIPSTP